MFKKTNHAGRRQERAKAAPLTVRQAAASARELLRSGFAVAALNAVVEEAKHAARAVMARVDARPATPGARRAALLKALDLVIARLQKTKAALKPKARAAGRPRKGK